MPDESIAQRQADEEAVRLSGKSDDEIAAELVAAEERFRRSYGLPVLDDMLKESILVDLGYVDGKALAVARRNAVSAPVVPDPLCDVLALEVGLRSLV